MKARGYTLVEIAVALIVIGLLLATVLTVDSALGASRVRSFAREAGALGQALELYRSRYGGLPGDDASAGTRWPGVASGNSNGTLGGRYDRAVPADAASLSDGNEDNESLLVWWHLRRAGFIVGATDGTAAATPPLSSLQQPLGIQSDLLGLPGMVTCIADASGAMAEAVDHAMDDGAPHTGTVRATSGGIVTTRYADDAHYQLCVSLEGRAGPALSPGNSTAGGAATNGGTTVASTSSDSGSTSGSGASGNAVSNSSSGTNANGTSGSNSNAGSSGNGNASSNGNVNSGSNGNSSSNDNGNAGSSSNSGANGNSGSNGSGHSGSHGSSNANGNSGSGSNGKGNSKNNDG